MGRDSPRGRQDQKLSWLSPLRPVTQRRESLPPWLSAYHIPRRIIAGLRGGKMVVTQDDMSQVCLSFHNLEGIELVPRAVRTPCGVEGSEERDQFDQGMTW